MFLVDKNLREDPTLLAKAREIREARVNDNEKKVPLAGLLPGMTLSRPLLSFDGREILPSNLSLDQDLIWRIWQLAALRPLNAPLVIYSGKSR